MKRGFEKETVEVVQRVLAPGHLMGLPDSGVELRALRAFSALGRVMRIVGIFAMNSEAESGRVADEICLLLRRSIDQVLSMRITGPAELRIFSDRAQSRVTAQAVQFPQPWSNSLRYRGLSVDFDR